MTIHQTLLTAIYLLAYDTKKNKLAKKAWLDYLVHRAALSELALDGYLQPSAGTHRPRPSASWQAVPGAPRRTVTVTLEEHHGMFRPPAGVVVYSRYSSVPPQQGSLPL